MQFFKASFWWPDLTYFSHTEESYVLWGTKTSFNIKRITLKKLFAHFFLAAKVLKKKTAALMSPIYNITYTVFLVLYKRLEFHIRKVGNIPNSSSYKYLLTFWDIMHNLISIFNLQKITLILLHPCEEF